MLILWQKIQSFWYGIQANTGLFWLLVGVLTLIAIILLAMILRSPPHKNTSKAVAIRKNLDNDTSFVPVNADKDTAELFLPLADKLIAEATQREGVSQELLQKIQDKMPESLEDVLLAIKKIKGSYADDLRRIISDEKLMLLYARILGQADYQPYTLAAAWRECPDPTVLPAFVELLASRDKAVQMSAVRLLTALNEPQCLVYLASALLQPHRYVPARVAEVLVALGESAAWLLCHLLPEISAENKPLVLSVLSQMQPGYPLEQVINCLSDNDAQVRRAAAATLGDANALIATPDLCKAAADENWAVRSAVAKALGQIAEPAAMLFLQRLAEDEIWIVSINAREALRRIESRNRIEGPA
ncbi:MAG: HEAT repeat domain-containing protein [Clostridiales bacterium]|nr:HEAT repeat domain-containing protein [Clostridiales bacterium]